MHIMFITLLLLLYCAIVSEFLWERSSGFTIVYIYIYICFLFFSLILEAIRVSLQNSVTELLKITSLIPTD